MSVVGAGGGPLVRWSAVAEKEQAKATQHLLLEGCSLLMPLAKVRRRGPLLQPGPKLKVVLSSASNFLHFHASVRW